MLQTSLGRNKFLIWLQLSHWIRCSSFISVIKNEIMTFFYGATTHIGLLRWSNCFSHGISSSSLILPAALYCVRKLNLLISSAAIPFLVFLPGPCAACYLPNVIPRILCKIVLPKTSKLLHSLRKLLCFPPIP